MMERKFTDDKIVKALEICSQNIVIRHNGLTYEGIPLRFLFEDALDLINRQKAEIERLNKLVIEKHKEINRLDNYIQYTRSEAIKEFAERLKAKAMLQHGGVTVVYGSNIDNILKEMTND